MAVGPAVAGAVTERSSAAGAFALQAVCYTAEGWLDKNRGYLHPDLAAVLCRSDG